MNFLWKYFSLLFQIWSEIRVLFQKNNSLKTEGKYFYPFVKRFLMFWHKFWSIFYSIEYDSETVTGAGEHRPTTADDIRPKLDLSIWTQENPLEDQNHRQTVPIWSNCFTYQSGVPRWLLASILLLAIVVLAWICCATTATAPEQHIKRKVSINQLV